MKRRKSRFVDQRGIEACIDQLQSIIDGLRAGSMAVEEEDQALLLHPRGPLDFEVRVEQLGTKETLRVEMSWKLTSQRTTKASAAPVSGPRELSNAVWEGPITAWPERAHPAPKPLVEAPAMDAAEIALRAGDLLAAGPLDADAAEMEVQEADILDAVDLVSVTTLRPLKRTVTACTCSGRSTEAALSTWPPQRSSVDDYLQFYVDARTVGSDGQWHIDRDRLVQSLANAGVDPLTQQELYSLALQADADRSSSFSERVVAALERASQQPLAAAG